MLTTLLVAATAAVSQYGDPVVVFDPPSMTWEERTTAEVLQGLVNRQGAVLFIGSPEDPWVEIYRERYGMPEPEVVRSLPELIERYADVPGGLVAYDAEIDGCRYVAVTLAGIEDLLPVADPGMAGGSGLDLVHDLRGQFDGTLDAYEWALEELMPRCNRQLAHAVDGTCDDIVAGLCNMTGFDWQAMNRGFVFNLAVSAKEVPSYGGALVGGSAEHAEMYGRILEALETPAEINGYGEPEDTWCKLISEHGHYSFHHGHNWSFHTNVPYQGGEFRQKGAPEDGLAEIDPGKYQVVFMLSEGDTMKGPLPFFYGSWMDPDRGTIPFNWGINPLMAERFPAMLDYYYDTATDQDCFFAGCSGAGYCYPDFMPNVEEFAEMTARYCELADVDCIDLWGARTEDARVRYGQAAQPLSLSANGGQARMTMPSPPLPVIDHGLMYWQHRATPEGTQYYKAFAQDDLRAEAVGWLVDRIEEIAAAHYAPFIILVYADLHSYDRHVMVHREVAETLDPERFEVMRLDTAVAGFRAWADGRVLLSTDGLNGKLRLGALGGLPTRVPLDLVNPSPSEVEATVSWTGIGEPSEVTVAVPPTEAREVPGLELTIPAGAEEAEGAVTITAAGRSDDYPATVAPVPYEGAATSARFAHQWAATSLQHHAGEAVEHDDALGGSAWRSPDAGGDTGHILFGPYVELPPGRYAVAYRVRLAEDVDSDDAVVLTVDINQGGYDGLNEGLGNKVVRAGELDADRWTWIVTEIDWAGSPNLMETRAHWPGEAALLLDRVAVFELDD
jgi:hypothetical protein